MHPMVHRLKFVHDALIETSFLWTKFCEKLVLPEDRLGNHVTRNSKFIELAAKRLQ